MSEHWDAIFAQKSNDELSWYQKEPTTSLEILTRWCRPDDAIIDIGAGSAGLAEHLIERRWRDVTLLDISREALDIAAKRLGSNATKVSYEIADIREWSPTRRYRVWHDRAVFHFLISAEEQRDYVLTAARALDLGAVLIVATFSPSGPTHCSGLPIVQHDSASITALFNAEFDLIDSRDEMHTTPFESTQSFTWSVLRRR